MADKKPSNAAIIRVHKDRGYTTMSNEHLLFLKPPMSLKAKGLLSMFLALPDDWNYSINGLSSICKESRDCIRSTISELIDFGYLEIEKQNGENGRFVYIYHIFERSRKKSPDTEKPHLENPIQENPIQEDPQAEQPHQEDPTQLNIKEVINEQINTNNLTTKGLFDLYKEICKSYPQPLELSSEREKKAAARLKYHPERSYWLTVFKKVEQSDLCRKYTFVTFDWFIKNNTNAQKVFEGNYDNKSGCNSAPAQNFAKNQGGGKYSSYMSKQEGC